MGPLPVRLHNCDASFSHHDDTGEGNLETAGALVGRASFSLYLFADIFMGIYERILPTKRFALDSPNL